MITGKTKTGFEYSIDERIKQDWRIIKEIPGLESKNGAKQIASCISLISVLFDDGGASLEAHVASLNDGYVPADKLMIEIADIISANDSIKKS